MKLNATRLQAIMDDEVGRGEECGCQLAIYRHGKLVLSLASGFTDESRTGKVTEQTLFPIYSCGKAVAATAVHRLVEKGLLNYNDRVADYWPEFGCLGKEDVRLFHVLSHRAGLQAIPPVNSTADLADWEGMCRKMEKAVPAWKPGTKCAYHGVTYAWLLGETVRRACGKPFRDVILDEVLKPLGIENSFFYGTNPEADRRCADVDVSAKPERKSWCADIFSCLPLRHGFLPSANGIANALSLGKHYAALAEECGGVRLLRKETLDRATTLCRDLEHDPITPGDWAVFGLGYALGGYPDHTGVYFGHGGALGAEGMLFRDSGLAIAFTKNKDLPSHPVHPVRDRISEELGLPIRHW